MADTKTSDETAATTPTGAELVRIVQGGSSKKTTLAVAGHQFRGAKVRLSSDDLTQNYTTETAMPFDIADFDTDGFWSAGSPTRLTIPAGKGITHVELTGQVQMTLGSASEWMTVGIKHSNSAGTILHQRGPRFMQRGNTGGTLGAVSGPLPVSDGDYFELTLRNQTDTSITIEGDQTNETFLALHVIGMEPI